MSPSDLDDPHVPSRPAVWSNTGDMTPPDPGSMLFFWTVLMLVVMVPVWGIVLGLISLLELAKGIPVSFIATIQEPIFFWSMLISVLMLPVMLACMSMTPAVMQFAFDTDRQLLTYIEVRPYRKPVEVEVPFDAIKYVAPYLVRQSDRIGHLALMVPDRKARRQQRDIEMVFGRLIPLAEMAELGDLLRPYLGKRMHDLHELEQ